MKAILPFGLVLILASCNPCKYVSNHPECFPSDTIREIETLTIRDTVTWIQADTFAMSALFYCDSARRVLMRDLTEYKSKGITTRIVYRDNQLQITAATDSIKILNRIISELKSKTVSTMNPINEQLAKENQKLREDIARLKNRMKHRSWLWYYFFGTIILFGLFAWWRLS